MPCLDYVLYFYCMCDFHAYIQVPPTWHYLTECKALDAIDSAHFPGAILFSLRFGPSVDAPDATQIDGSRPKFGVEQTEKTLLIQEMLRAGPSGEVTAMAAGQSGSPSLARDASLMRASLTSTSSVATALPDDDKEAKAPDTADDGTIWSVGKLTIKVLTGKNFPPIDNGSCDPIVKLVVGTEEKVCPPYRCVDVVGVVPDRF